MYLGRNTSPLSERRGVQSFDRQTVNVHLARLLDNVMGVVCLVDGNGYSVGSVGNLRYGVDDKTVILLAVVGCDNVKTVSDVEESGKIVLVSSAVLLSEIVTAKLVCKSGKLRRAFLI